MSGHDPLCPQSWGFIQSECRCSLIERVRADERERWLEGAEVYAEVRRAITTVIAEAERDAARAEVAALQRILDQAHADRDAAIADAARMEMGLVDMRAKVEGLREEAHDMYGEPDEAFWRYVAGAYDRVLALIEEVNRG